MFNPFLDFMDLKLNKNEPEMSQKWAKNEPKKGVKMTKSDQKWPKVDLKANIK